MKLSQPSLFARLWRRLLLVNEWSSPPLLAPALLRLALHRRRGWVLELQPVLRPAAAIDRAEPLADDALEPELARVAKNDVAGLGDVFVELQPEAGAAQQRGEPAPAGLDRLPPPGPAVPLQPLAGLKKNTALLPRG